ncbi:ran binding protein in the microtubule-organising centre [Astrocystis sublimbata]|nr:ran binding protein in the microtubule-organising centre [Astrocystis sublimbata]
MLRPAHVMSLADMMTSSSSTATLSVTHPVKHPFIQRVEDVQTPKSDINALILDYLTVAGYPNAAAKFSSEANLPPQQPTFAIQQRSIIRNYIQRGEIENAILELNEVSPSILDNDDMLLFALRRLQLVELIRVCNNSTERDITAALQFAQTKLGPQAVTRPEFLEALENTMSLLVFPKDDSLDPSISALLEPSLRREVADQVNQAILDHQNQRKQTAIQQLAQMRVWSEEATRKETKKDLPRIIELGLDGDDTARHDSQDGHEPMITT